jgi:hypothetical protein
MNKTLVTILIFSLLLLSSCSRNFFPTTTMESSQIKTQTLTSEPTLTITPRPILTINPTATSVPSPTANPDLSYWSDEGVWLSYNEIGSDIIKYLVINPIDLTYHFVTFSSDCDITPLQYSLKLLCRSEGTKAYLYDLKTGKSEEINLPFESNTLTIHEGIYSSSGNALLLIDESPPDQYEDIYKLDIPTGKNEKIARFVDFMVAAISSDGKHIIISKSTKEWSFHYLFKKGEPWELISLPLGLRAAPIAIWSPNESKVILGATNAIGWEGSTPVTHLYLLNLHQNHLSLIANAPDVWDASMYIEWSNDGKRIAYNTGTGSGEICIFELDSKNTLCYTLQDADGQMAWSPTNEEVAIDNYHGKVTFLSLDGSTRVLNLEELLGKEFHSFQLFWR